MYWHNQLNNKGKNMKNTVIKNAGIHGDVCIQRVTNIDLSTLTPKNSNILAYGEFTGHMHALGTPHTDVREFDAKTLEKFKDQFQMYTGKNGETYVDVKAPTALSHQEHFTHTLETGLYQIGIAREYNPFLDAIEPVKD